MTTTSPSSRRWDYGKLKTLSKIAIAHQEQLYEYFGIKSSYKNEILIKSVCPIHGGDNPTALNMYYNGDYKIHFKCRTHQCEEIFGNDLISFVRGVLSRLRHDWTQQGDKEAQFKDAVDFLLKFIGKDFDSLKAEDVNLEKLKFGSLVNGLNTESPKKGTITREAYRSKVQIPAEYYVSRGFSKEILDEYDVGFCSNPRKPMYQRAIVPIYDNEHQYMVGCTGRSIFEKCDECNNYHDPAKKCHHFPKWFHSKGFQKEKWLYNYWKAKEPISDSGVAIIVESPGNVWRLAEADIHNVVAIFGTAFNNDQKHLLDASGAFSLICLMDNDDAGRKAARKIEEVCGRLYRIFYPNFNANDIAELDLDNITADIKPWIDKAKQLYKGL